MSTKEVILDKAVHLFNHRGATAVSTVTLADELDMSIGNLYYHFKNKEHIIRKIYTDRIIPAMNSLYVDSKWDTEESLLKFFMDLAKYTYRYRFFYYEIQTIQRNDPIIHEIYRNRSVELTQKTKEMLEGLVASGIMKPMPDSDIGYFAFNLWMMFQLWVTYGNIVNREIGADDLISLEILHIYHILKPVFTEKSAAIFDRMIEGTHCSKITSGFL